MVRPKTKDELFHASVTQYHLLADTIKGLSSEEQEADFSFSSDFLEKKKEAHWARDKNLRDVLIHLYEWHQLLLNWVAANQQGQNQPFLPAPYNWRTYGEMNKQFVEKHQGTSLSEAKELLQKSHEQVMEMIQSFTNEELFAKGALPWTGTMTLGSYCVSATSSHYDWASKKIKQYKKSKK